MPRWPSRRVYCSYYTYPLRSKDTSVWEHGPLFEPRDLNLNVAYCYFPAKVEARSVWLGSICQSLRFCAALSYIAAPPKNLFERLAKDMRDAERYLQGRRIFALFDGGDGLACDADLVAEIALSHLAREEAQCSYIV